MKNIYDIGSPRPGNAITRDKKTTGRTAMSADNGVRDTGVNVATAREKPCIRPIPVIDGCVSRPSPVTSFHSPPIDVVVAVSSCPSVVASRSSRRHTARKNICLNEPSAMISIFHWSFCPIAVSLIIFRHRNTHARTHTRIIRALCTGPTIYGVSAALPPLSRDSFRQFVTALSLFTSFAVLINIRHKRRTIGRLI